MAAELLKNVFVSWAGESTRLVAEALKKGLGVLMQNARLWVSSKDLKIGDVWFTQILEQLDLKIGIVLLTPENKSSEWVNFEAGALLGGIKKKAAIFPILFGFDEGEHLDGRNPLSNVQQLHANEDGFRKVFAALGDAVGDPKDQLEREDAFRILWDSWLKAPVEAANEAGRKPKGETTKAAKVDPNDALDEIRQSLRELKATMVSRPTIYDQLRVSSLQDRDESALTDLDRPGIPSEVLHFSKLLAKKVVEEDHKGLTRFFGRLTARQLSEIVASAMRSSESGTLGYEEKVLSAATRILLERMPAERL